MKKRIVVITTALLLFVGTLNISGVKAESIADDTAVAAIGEVYYTSLQSAFDAVVENQTATVIKVIKDFVMETKDIATLSLNKEIILDLNGKSITVDNSFEGRPIVNLGTLQVKGNGKIDSSNSRNGYGAINNKGNLTIQDGTYSGNILGGGSAIRNTAGKLIINGGRFEKATCAIYNDVDTSCVINGGVFDNRTCSTCDRTNWSYCINNFGDITINNATVYGVQGALAIAGGTAVVNAGHFETFACDKHGSGPSHYALYVAGERGKTLATINGGDYISISKTAALIGNDNDGGEKLPAKCIINDGNFTTNGPDNILVIQGANISGDPSILGGTYCKAVKNEYLKDGYKQILKTDGRYVVAPKATAITITPSELSIENGKFYSLVAEVFPKASLDPVTWKSSDTAVATVDSIGKVTAIKAGKAKITATVGNVSATCEVIVYQQEAVEPPKIDIDKPVDEVTIGINDEKSNDIINSTVCDILSGNNDNLVDKDTLVNVKKAISEGKTITTSVITKMIDEDMLDKKVVGSFQAEADKSAGTNEKAVIAQYLDLSIGLMVGNEKLGEVNQLTGKIEFTLAMPENFVQEGRTYYILRMHDGKVTKLPVKMDGNILKFETDQFSTYALVYVEDLVQPDILPTPIDPETPIVDKPIVKTDDMSNIGTWVALITLSFVGVIILSKKYKYNR